MKITESMILPAGPDTVAAMYADPAYQTMRGQAMHAPETDTSVTGTPDGHFTVTARRKIDASVLPEKARAFAGSGLDTTETQTWNAPEGDGSRHGTLVLEVSGMPVRVEAGVSVRPEGDSSRIDIDGDVNVKIPLLGARLEKAMAPRIANLLRAEEQAAARYLAER
ncbi:DUF2505 domain-containing protein [Devriesea agamarum]|uniref:DUF2505 domain-containing protein n=1 Tax=Devriesea agamarum TaxID=472569 RepID=UPI00071C7375|nr:DUF2505 domain-containing protein [Devriesea agamarum]